jgi:putative SOS response-associated peptidase YedK
MLPWAEVVRLLRGEIRASVQGKPSWNVAPTQQVAMIEDSNTGRHLTSARWGLAVPWTTKPMINARSETAAEKPTFRKALQERRCLVPTTGFYEWKTDGDRKQPYLFRREDGAPFAIAGISDFYDTDGGIAQACAVLTTSGSAFMRQFHERMPVIVPEAAWDRWLDRTVTDAAAVADLLKPPPDDFLIAVPVSARVNSPRNNDAECTAAIGPSIQPASRAPWNARPPLISRGGRRLSLSCRRPTRMVDSRSRGRVP